MWKIAINLLVKILPAAFTHWFIYRQGKNNEKLKQLKEAVAKQEEWAKNNAEPFLGKQHVIKRLRKLAKK